MDMANEELKKIKIDKDDYEKICQQLNDKFNKFKYDTEDERRKVGTLKS